MNDKQILQFIHDRLLNVHGENENVDYMHSLRAVIARTPGHDKVEVLDEKMQFIGNAYSLDEAVQFAETSVGHKTIGAQCIIVRVLGTVRLVAEIKKEFPSL